MDGERKTSLEKMVATELLKLVMEMDEARLKKMVATTQLRLAPETEDERRARLEYLSDDPIYNKTVGRALDPCANGTWLSKLTE